MRNEWSFHEPQRVALDFQRLTNVRFMASIHVRFSEVFPPENHDAQPIDGQRNLLIQFRESLLPVGRGWRANHALREPGLTPWLAIHASSLTWPDANDAPPVYRVDLTRPVTNMEHGKAVWSSVPALAVPRQADHKAGSGETAWRGSNKPRPLGNGVDMPTSIWSFVTRKSVEPSHWEKQMMIDACRSVRPGTDARSAGLPG